MPGPGAERYPIAWIDSYAGQIRDYVFVRERDNLLIKVPNEAHKLNPSGIQLLQRLFAGERIVDIWQSFGGGEDIRRDIYQFFIGLKQVLQGCLNEKCLPEAVEQKPFALGFNALPVLSEVALTYRCNLACRFCYAGCSCTAKPEAPELDTRSVKAVLRTIREEAQTPSTSFTGGEPTLRGDLVELIRFARHDLGMRVNLITNGTRVDAALADALAEAGLHSAQVSIEAPEAKLHDALVQCPGAFGKSVRAAALLKERGIAVHTNTTLNRENLAAAREMPAFVAALGLERFSMNLVIPSGHGAGGETDITVRYKETGPHVLAIQRAAQTAGVEFMWYSPTPLCLFNPVAEGLGNKGCAACDGLLSVSPSGDVLPCSSWAEPVGNLVRDDFHAVWESARSRWIRAKRFAPRECEGCGDFALCQTACPLYWRHFGAQELEGKGERHAASRC